MKVNDLALTFEIADNPLQDDPSIPNQSQSLSRRIVWPIVSKAAERSVTLPGQI